MKQNHIELLTPLNLQYEIKFDKLEPYREGGNSTYYLYANNKKYFLKVIGSAFSDTFKSAVDINLYLMSKGFSVPKIIPTSDGRPFIDYKDRYIVVYEFLDAAEIDMEKDAEEVGGLVGSFHALMRKYGGKLAVHDRDFYLDRYICILRKKQYRKADEFEAYGRRLWNRIKELPRGYSHGDLYSGNIVRGCDGKLYILDFDTSCTGFPTYDLALICNRTDYFKYNIGGVSETAKISGRFLPEYSKHCPLTDFETNSLCNMLALYHFALQATIIEIYGLDCVDGAFFDRQLEWLKMWEEQTNSV